ncbi:hypothetical protein MRX96_039299 [Rhipicephalus microplus]
MTCGCQTLSKAPSKSRHSTATHLQTAALLPETPITVDNHCTGLPKHVEARQMAARPYSFDDVNIQFTEEEVREMIGEMPPCSPPAPDGIMPLLLKGLLKTHEIHDVCIQRGVRAWMCP